VACKVGGAGRSGTVAQRGIIAESERWAARRSSACLQVKIGLLFGALSKGVGAEVNLLALIGDPDNRMSVVANPDLPETIRILQTHEDFTAVDDWAKIDDARVVVVPFDFQNTVDNRFRRDDPWDLCHRTLPGGLPAAHASHAAINCICRDDAQFRTS
jgi:hypothetical protein